MSYLIDSFTSETSDFGPSWMPLTDQVLEGHSTLEQTYTEGEYLLKAQLESEKGFVQWALPLVHSRYLFDASAFEGVFLEVASDRSIPLRLLLRTRELSMPWQQFYSEVQLSLTTKRIQLPFNSFQAQATTHSLNLKCLTRIGIELTGFSGSCELKLKSLGFY